VALTRVIAEAIILQLLQIDLGPSPLGELNLLQQEVIPTAQLVVFLGQIHRQPEIINLKLNQLRARELTPELLDL
jgi:hypothetical protein